MGTIDTKDKQTEEYWYHTLDDKFAEFLTSKALFLLAFMGFMAYRYYESQQIFHDLLDDPWPSHVIAVVAVLTTLIFMVNSSYLAPIPVKDDEGKVTSQLHWSKVILVLYALIINIFFWKPWKADTQAEYYFLWFSCIMLSSMDFGFAHLFKEKQAQTTAQQELTSLDQQLTSKEEELTSLRQTHTNLQQEINQLTSRKKELADLIDQFTCPHCQQVYWPEKSITSHMSKCKQNSDSK
ncbi:hypothetical protein [Marinoscillum furvescens]|uniref:Uncharacterized protein n=1 Tax=Marinoscillum furvescens DSM 4134 TaxID=1122208 RepID=A0A3D9L4Y5_MARFU|nr:hypothetical protein [Marinoscillum furvescens]REE01085.1 hypothetical protein C7460_104105 [Marinoscillum furvescens DSM 4134]